MLAAIDWHIIWQRIFHPNHVFVLALWRTIYISVCAQALGVAIGLVTALMRMSSFPPFRWLSGLYVLIFRGTPLIVQIFFVYFGANLLFGFTLVLMKVLAWFDQNIIDGIVNLVGTFYCLCSVLDGYSRAIVHWDLRESMTEAEITDSTNHPVLNSSTPAWRYKSSTPNVI